MNTQPKPDTAIDKTLAALNAVPPPAGMEARIAHRLAQPAPISPRHTAFTPAWWSGAATGAAAALLIAGIALFASHKPDAGHATPKEIARAPLAVSTQTALAAQPCAHPAILRTHAPAATTRPTVLRADTFPAINAPSHPAPIRPLTAQERALVQLARTADPKMLVALAPETQARVEAQEEENFNKFFAPPPAPPQPVDSEPAAKPNQNQSQL